MKVRNTKQFEKDIKRITDMRVRRQIIDTVERVFVREETGSVKALIGQSEMLRLRAGKYRVLYWIERTNEESTVVLERLVGRDDLNISVERLN